MSYLNSLVYLKIKNILDDLYNEERSKPEEVILSYEDYLRLPKTDQYIKREEEQKKKEEEKEAYENRIEEKYNHIINKISNQ